MPARDIRGAMRKRHPAEGRNRYRSSLAQWRCVFMLETLSTQGYAGSNTPAMQDDHGLRADHWYHTPCLS